MSAPAISVILPAYNGAAWIAETIASVQRQTLRDWELIAVDDCSTDDTLAVLRGIADPRIRVVESATNGGPVAARNLAFARARGRYIVGLDQDDLCLPTRFARQLAELEARPELVLVATRCSLLTDGVVSAWPGPRDLDPVAIDWLLMTQNPLVWSSVMIRGDVARTLFPFERPHVRYAEDFDLYTRLSARGGLLRLEEPLVLYRNHPGGASKRFRERMAASAATVLAERHEAVFGAETPHRVAAIVHHLMGREVVPDAAALQCLFDGVERLHRHYLDTRRPDAAARARIGREYHRLWWQVVRPAVRTGALSVAQAVAARPGSIQIAPTHPERFLSPLIGGVRAWRRARRG
jgi:glycosyltransferase involved in cell wall biosynthesis